MGLQAAFRPAGRPFQRIPTYSRSAGIWRAFVEGHDHIGAQGVLDLDRFFRTEEQRFTADMGPEGDPFLRNLTQLAETEHLKPAAVGQYPAIPVHKAVQPPCLPDDLMTRTEIEMVRIAQNDPAPISFNSSGLIVLTVAWVPTGMNTGVSKFREGYAAVPNGPRICLHTLINS